MGILFMIVTGAVLGWLVAFVFRADGTGRGLQLNIGAGLAGSLVAGLVISPAIGTGDLLGSRYSVGAIAMCMVGALAVLLPLNFLNLRALR